MTRRANQYSPDIEELHQDLASYCPCDPIFQSQYQHVRGWALDRQERPETRAQAFIILCATGHDSAKECKQIYVEGIRFVLQARRSQSLSQSQASYLGDYLKDLADRFQSVTNTY
jgi:hypothetical protein